MVCVQNKIKIQLPYVSKLTFLRDQSEWTDTRIIFEVSSKANQTEVRFTHEGLNPGIECYNACSNAWAEYIRGSLKLLITAGKGKSSLKDL